jgi:tRNA G10  N-methylase Trm11
VIFNQEEKDKVLFSDLKVDPSISPFIKNRVEILLKSESFTDLIKKVIDQDIHIEGFKVEYVILTGDLADYDERRLKLKSVGYSINGEPSFEYPMITYTICTFENTWYFGVLVKHDSSWQKHKQKIWSFSNSISMDIAKSLVNIASKGNKSSKLLDACCGVGTIMLEACVSGFNIEGCDINLKRTEHTQQNLDQYYYDAIVHCSDIKDLNKNFDAAIIDLPYNLYSISDELTTINIIESTSKLADRIVIVSTTDIGATIKNNGLKIIDFCTVGKRGKSKFERKIWVCEKDI